jgi:hypothetical protein
MLLAVAVNPPIAKHLTLRTDKSILLGIIEEAL